MENQTKNIQEIELDNILAHPTQTEVYGVTSIDSDFINSIKDRGIIQNVILCEGALFVKSHGFQYEGKYVIVAGHRRVAAAEELKMISVPAEIKNYTNIEETEVDLIVSNKQRKKTPKQIFNESEKYKNLILSIRASLKNSNTYKGTNDGENQMSEHSHNIEYDINNKDIQRIIEMLKMNYRQSEIIAENLEISKDEVKRLNCVYSEDYLQNHIDNWYDWKVNETTIENNLKYLNEVRDDFDNQKETTNSAFVKIQNLIKSMIKLYKPKEKKEKKEKAPKVEKIKVFVPYFNKFDEIKQGEIIAYYDHNYEVINSKNDYFYNDTNDQLIDELIIDNTLLSKSDLLHLEFMENDEMYIALTKYFTHLANLLKVKINYRD